MARRERTDNTYGLDSMLLIIVAVLLLIGLLMVYSAIFATGTNEDPLPFLTRQVLWIAIGGVVLAVLLRLEYHIWQRWALPLMGGAILMLIAVLFVGESTLGAQRSFSGGSIRPAEFAKLAAIIYVAAWAASKQEQIKDLSYGLLPFAIIVGVVAGLMVQLPNFSAAVLVTVTAMVMFFLAGADLQQLTIALSITGGLLGLSASQIEYVANRLANFITPQTNVINYQAQQAITVFYSGGLWGQGPVSTMRDPVHVPAAHTDTIFAIIGHDFGIIGALIVVMLFIALAYRGVRIAQHAPDPFGMLLAVGVTCWLTIQAFTHIAVVLELVPTTGVNLPFISYGGSSMLVTMAGIGLLLSVSRSTSEETAAASTRAQQRTTRKSNGRQATSYAYGWRYRRPRLSGNRHR